MNKGIEKFPVHIPQHQRKADNTYYEELSAYFETSIGTSLDKLRSFTKYTPVAELNRLLAKNEIFKKILNIHGNVIECGVFMGGGLMSWANFSAIYEPLNHTRKIIGFDTFEGFVGVNEKDQGNYNNTNLVEKGLEVNSYDDLKKCIEVFDIYRPLGHIQKVELVKGDVTNTFNEFLQQNQHTLVALLYLDFDLYEPTRLALKTFLPRMPKGAIIAFDELNQKFWPGETIGLLEELNINNYKIERFTFQPQISYIIL